MKFLETIEVPFLDNFKPGLLKDLIGKNTIVDHVLKLEKNANLHADMLKFVRLYPNVPLITPLLDAFQPIIPFAWDGTETVRNPDRTVSEMLSIKVSWYLVFLK